MSLFNLSYFTCQSKEKQRKKLTSWSTDDVCSWLVSLDLELYCESFRRNAIDGEELLHVSNELLASDLGVGESVLENTVLIRDCFIYCYVLGHMLLLKFTNFHGSKPALKSLGLWKKTRSLCMSNNNILYGIAASV